VARIPLANRSNPSAYSSPRNHHAMPMTMPRHNVNQIGATSVLMRVLVVARLIAEMKETIGSQRVGAIVGQYLTMDRLLLRYWDVQRAITVPYSEKKIDPIKAEEGMVKLGTR
jgi:hypothetical protein